MNPTHVSRRAPLRGAALSSLSLALALSLSGCKGAGETTAAGSGAGSNSSTTTTSANTAPASTGDTLTIGHFGSLTGTTATFGKSTDKGIRMAFDEINAKGGILGKQLNLVTEDDGSQTTQVPSVVNKLINQSNVLCLMGEVASSRSKAAAPIAQKAGVPMVTASSTNPDVTKFGDYIFRTCFILLGFDTPQQAAAWDGVNLGHESLCPQEPQRVGSSVSLGVSLQVSARGGG